VSDGSVTRFMTELDVAVRNTKRKVRAKKNTRPLSLETLADLKRSGLTASDAEVMGIEDVTPAWCLEHVKQSCGGYHIPYTGFGGHANGFYRVRHHVPAPRNFGGVSVTFDFEKYMQPAGSGVRAYLPACVGWEKVLTDESIQIVITEGEKKAFSMCKAGFITLGLGGVFNFRDKGQLLDELVKLAKGRKITVCFDSDRHTNRHIQQAEVILCALLQMAGASVSIAAIPADGEKKIGLDDLLVTIGKHAVAAVLEAAVDFTPRDLVAGIRKSEKSNADRHRHVADALVSIFKINGKFIRTPESLLYFENHRKTLVGLNAEKDRELRAFIDQRTSVTGACPEWDIVFERFANTAHSEGYRAHVAKLSRIGPSRRRNYSAPMRAAGPWSTTAPTKC
jgi:hypothetical protein